MKTNTLKLITTLALATLITSVAADDTGVGTVAITVKLDKMIEQNLTDSLQRQISPSNFKLNEVNTKTAQDVILRPDCLCTVKTYGWISKLPVL